MEKGNRNYLIYTVIAGCVICMIAVCFNVFTDMELPGRIMAAILGVVITATITQLLLQGQTQKEGKLRKESKVFEEKLRIYQNFLNVLYQAVKDGELTDSEKLDLQFQTSLVAMHCDPQCIEKVSEAVKGVIDSTCCSNDKETSAERINKAELLKSLFEVVGAFRMDLYDKEANWFDDEDQQQLEKCDEKKQDNEKRKPSKKYTIDKFASAFNNNELTIGTDEPEKPQKLSVDLNVSNQLLQTLSTLQNSQASTPTEKIITATQAKSVSAWNKAKTEWESKGWSVSGPNDGDGYWLTITNNDKEKNPGLISIGLYKGHYCIQATYEEDTDFSQSLKNEFGGCRLRGSWKKYLPEPYLDKQMNELTDAFKTDVQLQDYIINRINYLQDVISKYNCTVQWKNALGKSDNWTYYIYKWTCLACQCNDDKEGRLFIDIKRVQDGDKTVVEFRLGNRAGNVEMLRSTLRNLGFSDDTKIEKDCWACVDKCVADKVESLDADKIVQKANALIKQLSR